MPQQQATVCFQTALGGVEVCATEKGIRRVHLGCPRAPRAVGDGRALDMALQAQEEILAYFAGRGRSFRVPKALQGTDFQLRVWEELSAIPYGATATYGELATRLGIPRGARAIGLACAANPCPLLVPCHRVVGKGGQLGGFAAGLEWKRALLKLEAEQLRQWGRDVDFSQFQEQAGGEQPWWEDDDLCVRFW